MNISDYSSVRCTCETEECDSGENCCPVIKKSKFFYTKHRRLRSRFNELSNEYLIVECYGCQCRDDCPTKIVQNGRHYKVAIVRTETRGWDIFALENMPSNVFVVEYIGEVLTITEGDSRCDSMYQFELSGYSEIKYLIDAKYYGNEAAFIKHSCSPNLVAVRVFLKDVARTFIHSFIYLLMTRINLKLFRWKMETRNDINVREGTMECSCGASKCMRYWPQLVVDNCGSDEDNKENSFVKSK
ncbi:SET domain family protein [Acanthocheilonema viteae]